MRVKVWDGAVRVLHGTLVLSLALATLSLWWLGQLHQPAGYVALAAVALRLLWGAWFAPRAGYARFAQFVRSPRVTLAYLHLLLRHHEPRYIGHNPLGGWMVLALMACVAGLGLTGWLYTTDWLWGDEHVEQVHVVLAWTLGVLANLHLAGVAFTSWRHRENLAAAMLSGDKRAPAEGDVS
jgi:cytochrome b